MHSTRSRVRAASAVVAVVFAFAACGGTLPRSIVPNDHPPDFGPDGAPVCSGNLAGDNQQSVDPSGGEVTIPGRDHVLTVLRNGVSSPTPFRMVQHQRDFVLVQITPSPHAFNRPAVLTLSYKGCELENADPMDLKIFRFNHSPGVNKWEPVPSLPDPNSETVSALIGTLSDYAMGTG